MNGLNGLIQSHQLEMIFFRKMSSLNDLINDDLGKHLKLRLF